MRESIIGEKKLAGSATEFELPVPFQENRVIPSVLFGSCSSDIFFQIEFGFLV